jgi:hypothetical protein
MAVSDGASSAGLSVDGEAAADGEAAGGGWAGAGDAAGGVDCCFSGAAPPHAPHNPITTAASTAVRPRKFDARMVVIVKPVWQMKDGLRIIPKADRRAGKDRKRDNPEP